MYGLFLCAFAGFSAQANTPRDSVGIERNLGEMFVLHQVSEGETLFAIAQRYGVPMHDLKLLNQEIDFKKLDIGDTLRIPMFPELTKGRKQQHTVQEGETLFGLSQRYGASVDDIRTWNALGDKAIAIGQNLIVYLDIPAEKDEMSLDAARYILHTVDEGETLYAISRTYGVPVDQLQQRNQLTTASLQFGQQLIIRERNETSNQVASSEGASSKGASSDRMAPPAPVASNEAAPVAAAERANQPPSPNLSKTAALAAERSRFTRIKKQEETALEETEAVSELGFASVIQGGGATKKYLALHRSAPVGTVLRVRNEMNEMSVFVRVVGKLPDTGVNNKISIRLTPAAYDKLGGINERFPVEISYLK